MACTDCLQNCPEIVSDQCVQYTGPALATPFNVCTGDQLPVYDTAVVRVLQSAIDGTGIFPTPIDISICTWIQQQFGILPLNLTNIAQVLINNDCSLYAMITSLQTQFTNSQSGTVIDTACLTGLPTTPTTPQLIQAIILSLCATNTTVASFPTTYVRLSDLASLITPIVNSIISGGSNVTQYNSRMVPYAALPYFGPLSNFDSTGAGISSLGFTRVFLCNGNNGTPDIRGRVVVSAIRNVPGGSLDPAVDPTVDPNNPNWALNDKAGETFHTLNVTEIPSHSHTVNDPQHTHTVLRGDGYSGNSQQAAGRAGGGQGTNPQSNAITGASSTGITLALTGGGQPHINIQPSIASFYIMYIP